MDMAQILYRDKIQREIQKLYSSLAWSKYGEKKMKTKKARDFFDSYDLKSIQRENIDEKKLKFSRASEVEAKKRAEAK